MPLGLYDLKDFDLLTVNPMDWAPIIYTAFFVNVISFVLWFRGIDKVGVTAAGAFTVVMPITTLILSNQILGEPITFSMVVGMGIVIVGLLLVITSPRKIKRNENIHP